MRKCEGCKNQFEDAEMSRWKEINIYTCPACTKQIVIAFSNNHADKGQGYE